MQPLAVQGRKAGLPARPKTESGGCGKQKNPTTHHKEEPMRLLLFFRIIQTRQTPCLKFVTFSRLPACISRVKIQQTSVKAAETAENQRRRCICRFQPLFMLYGELSGWHWKKPTQGGLQPHFPRTENIRALDGGSGSLKLASGTVRNPIHLRTVPKATGTASVIVPVWVFGRSRQGHGIYGLFYIVKTGRSGLYGK